MMRSFPLREKRGWDGILYENELIYLTQSSIPYLRSRRATIRVAPFVELNPNHPVRYADTPPYERRGKPPDLFPAERVRPMRTLAGRAALADGEVWI
jgi:hypothetical protein